MAKSTFLFLITVTYLRYCSARALAGPVNQRLLLILMDGLRYDYLNQSSLSLPGFQKIMTQGAKSDAFIPDFPTLSYPNYYSIMTGLHTESHGMTGNLMYDYARKEAFLIGTNPEQFNAHWWDGGDPLWTTAVRQNKKVHMYYWPGCEVEIRGLRPTNCTHYTTVPTMDDFKRAVNTSLDVLKNKNTDVAAIYFELTDSVGHAYGPFSAELNRVLLDLDPLISDLAASLTLDPDLSDVNLLIFSDHGMTPTSETRVINLTSILVPEDYEAVLEFAAITSIYTRAGKENDVYAKLENFHPNLTVYRKSDLPDRWFYKLGKYVAPLTAVCDKGWFVAVPTHPGYPVRKEDGRPKLGWHGYDSKETDMYGTFLGMGPAFNRNTKTAAIHTVDVYQVMCDILGISASPNNGSATRVSPLLREATGSSSMTSPHVTALIMSCLMALFVATVC